MSSDLADTVLLERYTSHFLKTYLSIKSLQTIGDEICSELTRLIYSEINIKVQFDSKQNTFRQLRKVYPQEGKLILTESIQVNVKVKEEDHVTHTGVPMFKNDYGYKGVSGISSVNSNRGCIIIKWVSKYPITDGTTQPHQVLALVR